MTDKGRSSPTPTFPFLKYILLLVWNLDWIGGICVFESLFSLLSSLYFRRRRRRSWIKKWFCSVDSVRSNNILIPMGCFLTCFGGVSNRKKRRKQPQRFLLRDRVSSWSSSSSGSTSKQSKSLPFICVYIDGR